MHSRSSSPVKQRATISSSACLYNETTHGFFRVTGRVSCSARRCPRVPQKRIQFEWLAGSGGPPLRYVCEMGAYDPPLHRLVAYARRRETRLHRGNSWFGLRSEPFLCDCSHSNASAGGHGRPAVPEVPRGSRMVLRVSRQSLRTSGPLAAPTFSFRSDKTAIFGKVRLKMHGWADCSFRDLHGGHNCPECSSVAQTQRI
jgi:hypothetical protein